MLISAVHISDVLPTMQKEDERAIPELSQEKKVDLPQLRSGEIPGGEEQ
jgi:hypothetical protein